MRKMLSKTTSSGETAFPWKLHMVLEESSFEGFDDIISWIGTNAFKVHDPIQFEESVMQRFFNQTQYKSFQRQLNIYGFTRVKTAGKATGSYTHPLFIRGNPDACAFMVRVKVKKKGIRKNLSRNSNSKPLRNVLDESQGGPIKITSYPLHRRFVSLNNNVATSSNGIIEPTPLRSVSPSNMKNDVFEPTPLCIQSMANNRRAKAMSVTSMHNIVPCESGGYINHHLICASPPRLDDSTRSTASSSATGSSSSNIRSEILPSIQHQRQHHYSKRRLSQFANVDLDLDTIFDDDNSNSRINNNIFKLGNGYIGGSTTEPSLFNPFAMDNACFNRNFHMVDEQIVPSAVTSRTVGSY
eukprot:CAMPEP_0116124344 /NCGR_PEP_ID=MMETSP0329-20121206/5231_1 /TAXON_ID=697910 /ORGANISM="Pseudo-nitzschia arenysensis, Strain B593" /LENGTH=354 /DNA_ID=CAMNT_0003618319 /DNA_START=81 /DNA_END=1145 /DNA_ORIENTATION=+